MSYMICQVCGKPNGMIGAMLLTCDCAVQNKPEIKLETAWVIERSDGPVPLWFTVSHGDVLWSMDSREAIRFMRRVDAEKLTELWGGFEGLAVHIYEHVWD